MPQVLIIDDDELITGALFRYLIGNGVSADLAFNPMDAEKFLMANDYSLVLMDAYLTGQLNNRPYELIDQVRSWRPSAHVVLLTAYSSPALSDHIKRDQRVMIVDKPQSIPYLAELIDGFLRREIVAVSP